MFWKKKTDIILEWSWEDDNQPDYSLIIEIRSATPDKKRLFGGNNYRYIAGTVHSGITITGVITDHNTLSGKTLSLRLPDDEIEKIAAGDKVKLDIVNDSLCIRVNRV